MVDFPAEVSFVGSVCGTVQEELHGLGLVGAVLVVEGVGAVVAVIGVALVALYAGAWDIVHVNLTIHSNNIMECRVIKVMFGNMRS